MNTEIRAAATARAASPTPQRTISLPYELSETQSSIDALFTGLLHALEEALDTILVKDMELVEPTPPTDGGLPSAVAVARTINHRILVATDRLTALQRRLAL
jgi:hypothetical protein